MTTYVPFDRNQPFLLAPDLKNWLSEDDIAHFIVAAVDRVRMGAFGVNPQAGGKPQYHPRLMLALLVYSYANGIFSSRRIERATWRDIAVRFIAANTHPDHDTIANFRRANKAAFEAAFLEVLLLARESGLLRLGMVSIDGTKIDANASKIRSVRGACPRAGRRPDPWDRALALREKLAADIAALSAKAEAADAEDVDRQALPKEIARREALKAKLDAACERLEAEAKARAEAEQPQYETKKAAYEAKKGRRGRPPKPPDETPPPTRQSNLTDPDSALMRRSEAHEYRQAYNAQAVVCAEGTQLILVTNLLATSADAPSFAQTILAMEKTIGLPRTVLADAGYASGEAVAELQARKIEPLVAIARTQPMENRNGLIVDAELTQATGWAERAAAEAMIETTAPAGGVTLGADKGYDTAAHVASLRRLGVTPHVARNTNGRRSAIDGRTPRHPGYAISQRIRKRIEEPFGWMKSAAAFRQAKHRGRDRVGWMFILKAAAYNLVRLPKLFSAT